jgi:hypothetical protein
MIYSELQIESVELKKFFGRTQKHGKRMFLTARPYAFIVAPGMLRA